MDSKKRERRLQGTSNGPAVRAANLQAILNALRDGSWLSASDISKLVGIHSSTVSRLLYTLEEVGLVQRASEGGRASVGRPRHLWSVKPSAAYALGIAVHPQYLRTVLVDLCGTVQVRRSHTFDPVLTTDNLVNAIRRIAESATKKVAESSVLGVGIGVSGIVDSASGMVKLSGGLFTRPGIRAQNYPLRAELEKVLPWPVEVANDANLGALAAFRHCVRVGELSSDGSLLYIMAVNMPWGFGSGIIISGKLYEGAHAAAGEILHHSLFSTQPEWGNLPAQVLARDQEASRKLIKLLTPFLEHIAAVALTLDPERVVLGGELAALGEPLVRTIAEIISSTPGYGAHLTELVEHGLIIDPQRPDTVAIGAAELVLEAIFSEPSPTHPSPLIATLLNVSSERIGEQFS
ncbi:MAG: ROK family protein [Candidatus Zipacnadales bacterium]